MINAVEAIALTKKMEEKHKNKELAKLQTIMKNIEARARAGYNFYFYQPLVTRSMAKTLIEAGYTLKYKGKYKREPRSGWYGCYKVYDRDKATPLTMKDYKEADAYPEVFIFWGEEENKEVKSD